MASGELLYAVPATGGDPPLTGGPGLEQSTNGRSRLAFDPGANEKYLYAMLIAPNYAGGGLDLVATVASSTATSGNMVWSARIDRVGAAITTDTFGAAQSATVAAPGVLGDTVEVTIQFADGAEMDSAVAGEWIYVELTREGLNGSDTMANDAHLYLVSLLET